MSEKIDLRKLISGERRSLAKAITLIESSRPDDNFLAQDLLEKILPHTGKSIRLGITGVPGVGKSTFIENFGLYLINQGHKVAVLAIDPSSPISGGSILGDKTRMELLSRDINAFIRPSPTLGFLGGVAQKTRESILLCEAAGFDYILVETVGVGQSEFEVADMVDFFLVLMLPNAGDELQGIKKGILELADAVIINKADGDTLPLANRTMAQYTSALELMRHDPHWKAPVLQCSALEKKNLDIIYDMIQKYHQTTLESGYFKSKRLSQNKEWFRTLINEIIHSRLNSNKLFENEKIRLEFEVVNGQKMPLAAAMEYINLFLKI
ncbi:MAG: methylmalonyl Co-A mutase-associated GTPase MeaB [Bacteriovorax sp.]|nr:methylmalonyl Co-A mutase-associated GTPase MeaB [Bacteriovorax sp.]